MSEAGKRMIAGAIEMIEVARGEVPAVSIFHNGHRYVPESALATAREDGYRAGRLAGLEETEKAVAEKLELAFLEKMDSAISGPFRIGLNTALDVIRSLKEKQP